MDAVLTPHRSLSFPAFRIVITLFAGANVALAAYFIAQGAYPVVGFLGLDVLLLWLAFRANYRAAEHAERVQVGAEHIHLARESRKRSDHFVVSPLWAQVSRDARGVRIASGGGAMRVGAFLSPAEQGAFARALDAALRRARRGDHRPSTSDIV